MLDQSDRRVRLRTLSRVPPADAKKRLSAPAMIAVLVSFLASASGAGAAAPSPDPAPQAGSSGQSTARSPDPTPQAPATHSSASGGSSGSPVTVLPPTTAGGLAIAAPSSSAPRSTSTTSEAVVQPQSPARPSRHASHLRVSHRHRRPVPTATHHAISVPRPEVGAHQLAVATRAATSSRTGLLLLLGAVAMFVLALASGSMLKLLRRMGGARV